MGDIIHGELFDTNAVTATLTALTPVDTNGALVKLLQNPRFAGVMFYGPDETDYGTLHNPDSFAGVDPALVRRGVAQSGEYRGNLMPFFQKNPVAVLPKSEYTLKGYQSSGAGADINAILWHIYTKPDANSIPRKTVRGLPNGRRVSKGANLTADAWTIVNTLSDLKTNKQYALVGAVAIGANARAVRFNHPDFSGLYPMLPAQSQVNFGPSLEFPWCPVFNGSDPLEIWGYTSAAEDMTVVVDLREL